jgi:hypothetical protein
MNKTDQVKRRLRAAGDAGPRVDWILGAALGLAAVVLYLSARNVFYSFDPLFYAEAVELGTADRLLHPHHLLYNPICRLAYGGARFLGYGGRALAPMHVVNALAGGAGVAFMFALCRRLGARRWASLWAAVGVATAAAYWASAAGVEVYTLGTAAALAALYAATQVPSRGKKAAALAGAAFAGAALTHQLNLLLAPAGFIYVLITGNAGRKKALAFAGGYAAAFAVGYVAVPAALLGLETPRAYADWFFAFKLFNRWGGLSWGNFVPGANAFARAFYADAFGDNFAAPVIKTDIRHLRVALPLWLAVAFCGANLLLWLTRRPGRGALILLGLPLLLYVGFILWWLPAYDNYWLLPAACFLGVVAVAASGRERRWYGVSILALAVAWLGITNVNWRRVIKPHTHLEANADYRAGVALAELVPRDALVYLAPYPPMPHARYFGGLKNVRTPNWAVNRYAGDSEKAARRIERLMRREWDNGRPVYVGDRAFPGIGGPPLRTLGERLIRQGHPVGSYVGNGVSEIIYAVPPGASVF